MYNNIKLSKYFQKLLYCPQDKSDMMLFFKSHYIDSIILEKDYSSILENYDMSFTQLDILFIIARYSAKNVNDLFLSTKEKVKQEVNFIYNLFGNDIKTKLIENNFDGFLSHYLIHQEKLQSKNIDINFLIDEIKIYWNKQIYPNMNVSSLLVL